MALLCRTHVDVCRSCSQRFVLAHAGTPELKVLAFRRMSHKAMCLELVGLHSAVCCRPDATQRHSSKNLARPGQPSEASGIRRQTMQRVQAIATIALLS
jgi:hypothetical protein